MDNTLPQSSEDKLREKIVALKHIRDYHLMDEPEYVDAIMQAVKAELGAALKDEEFMAKPGGVIWQRNKLRAELRNHFGIGEEQA